MEHDMTFESSNDIPSHTTRSKGNPFTNKVKSIREVFGKTKILVHILICIFAVASWIDINGMWAELPLLVEKAKEQWTLPSYIIVIGQCANIGPLIFVIVSCLAPQTKPKLEKVTSFMIIVLGVVSCILLAFFWEYTSYIGDTEHSTALLVLNFFLSLGDCTSSVSFFAFMSHMKPEYMATFFIGEGLSGLIPAVIAIGQGSGDIHCNGTMAIRTEPRFSVKIYFIILAAIILLSAIAFLLLNFTSYCRTEMVPDPPEKALSSAQKLTSPYGALENQDLCSSGRNAVLKGSENRQYDVPFSAEDGEQKSVSTELNQERDCGSRFSDPEISSYNSNHSSHSVLVPSKKRFNIPGISLWKFFLLLSLIILINMTLTTFLSSIQIYSILPYGLEYYHLSTTLPQIANPVACVFALFIMAENTVVLLIVTFLGQCCVGYIIYVATMSPMPLLHESSTGGRLAVGIWVAVTLLLVYAKVCIAGVMRKHGRVPLICAGACTQTGTLIGSIVGFVLVNEYSFFKEAPWCKG